MISKTLVFLGIFGLFLFTMAPTLTVGDSGEFCASSVILGVPHSPGYPLYCLLGKFFTLIIPFADYAYRVNVMSAFFGALTVTLVFIFLKRNLGKHQGTAGALNGRAMGAALGGALFLAFTLCFWRTSVQSEVFTLSSFFAALCVLLLDASAEKPALFATASFVFGLSCGNQQTIVLILPLFAFVFWFNRKRWPAAQPPAVARIAAASLICFIIGFSVYLYLPVRASKGPEINWGNPANFENFVRVLLRKDYGTFQLTVGEKTQPGTGFSQSRVSGASIFLKQLARYFSTLIQQTGIAGAALGLLGWIPLVRHKRSYGAGLLAAFVFSGPVFMLISNLSFDPLSEGILERFYILPMVFFAVSAGYAAKWLVEKHRLLVLFCLILPVGAFTNSSRNCFWRNYYLEYDYAANILKTLKPGSVFFMDGGDDTFYGMQYLCFAKGKRRDVELHDRGGLVFRSVYGKDFRRISREMKETRRQETETAYLGKKPLYYSTFNRSILPGARLRPDGILYEAMPPALKLSGVDSWELYTLLRGAFSTYSDYRSAALAPVYVFMRYDNYGRDEAWADYAMDVWPDVLWLNGNLKYSLHETAYKAFGESNLVKAGHYFEKILRIDPGDRHALLNLGVVREKQNDLEGAVKLYEKAISLDPSDAEAYYNLGVVYWRKSDWGKVVRSFQKVLEINPNHEAARRYLQQLRGSGLDF